MSLTGEIVRLNAELEAKRSELSDLETHRGSALPMVWSLGTGPIPPREYERLPEAELRARMAWLRTQIAELEADKAYLERDLEAKLSGREPQAHSQIQPPHTPVTESDFPQFQHSEDFRSLNFRGMHYTATKSQAVAIRLLYEAWKNGTPELGDEHVMEALKSDAELRDIFRTSMLWNNLIIRGKTKGTHRLNLPGPA